MIRRDRNLFVPLVVGMIVAATTGIASADWATATVTAGANPYALAVNPITDKVYVANYGNRSVTVIDGATNSTTTVHADSLPYAVAVNPVTNRIYVANYWGDDVTVIDGVTNDTTLVPVGGWPIALAVNPVTDKIYVADDYTEDVTVIDGATDSTTRVTANYEPYAIAVNTITNKVYVANYDNRDVTVIDGATNTTTVAAAGSIPFADVANPVTNRVYIANMNGNNVTVISDVPSNDTKVRGAFDLLRGDTTTLARPVLTGKGVNRSTPNATAMMGVCNRLNTAQAVWNWATVTSGAGTDSIEWTYNWGADSLIPGENFVCAQPLESDAGITNNEGVGTPFAGNLEVHPIYRVGVAGGIADEHREPVPGVLTLSVFPNPCPGKARITYSLPRSGNVSLELYDVTGKLVTTLAKGYHAAGRYNMVLTPTLYSVRGRSLAQGVYLVRLETSSQAVNRKLIIE